MQNRASNEPLRVLLTGAGSIARRHAQNLRQLVPDVQVTMVSTRARPDGEAAGEGVMLVPSLAAGLESGPNIAVVCSISAAHAQELSLLMPQVEALYIEKPVVIDRGGLQAIRALLESGWDKPTVVGCNLRYLGVVRKLKAVCDAGDAGRLARASLQVGQWLPDWRVGRDHRESYSAKRAQGGGVIFDLVHEIDSASFLFGDIARGQAAAGNSGSLGIDSDDAATVSLMMESGLPVEVSLDYISRKPLREYRVVGDRGTLRVDIIARQLVLETSSETRVLPTEAADWDLAGTYRLAMEDLLRAWRTGSPTFYSLPQSLATTAWMIELETSAWRKPGEARTR
ncbi:MAG TPA: Gfo/Idh/MocA family oxidoreductase [Ramlibacter sp.]|nr:Gfo/Idh/MocA family oxidoreductase [Ramlibacter sp.]